MGATWIRAGETENASNLILIIPFPFSRCLLDGKSPIGDPMIRRFFLETDAKALPNPATTGHYNHNVKFFLQRTLLTWKSQYPKRNVNDKFLLAVQGFIG